MKYSNPTLKRSSLMCHWFLIPLLSCWSQTDLMLLTFHLCKQQSNTERVPSFVFPTWLVFTVFIYLLPLNPFQGRSRANPGSRGLRAGHSLHPGPQPITLTFIFMADSKWTDLFFFPVCLSTVVLDNAVPTCVHRGACIYSLFGMLKDQSFARRSQSVPEVPCYYSTNPWFKYSSKP